MVLDYHCWFHTGGNGSTHSVHYGMFSASSRRILGTQSQNPDQLRSGTWKSTHSSYMVNRSMNASLVLRIASVRRIESYEIL